MLGIKHGSRIGSAFGWNLKALRVLVSVAKQVTVTLVSLLCYSHTAGERHPTKHPACPHHAGNMPAHNLIGCGPTAYPLSVWCLDRGHCILNGQVNFATQPHAVS
eukprot:jgi/Botrbrau1/21811/Bobra.0190s0031.1